MNKDQAKEILTSNGFVITDEAGIPHGTKLVLDNGAIVNVYYSGKYAVQGKNTEAVEALLQGTDSSSIPENRKVFVVYDHDINARTQLDAMLRRWEFDQIILDQLTSSGQTIIEKLEEYIEQASFGIVLATPDDCGYAKGTPEKVRYRVRQNVVLELGMLLSKLGRSKVAILLSQSVEDMEPPSDIHDLVWIPFKDNVEEAGKSLAKEMSKNGYHIPIDIL